MIPSVAIEKSPIPVLWLDTSIIFDITLLRMGKRLDEARRRRAKFLYDSICYSVEDGKLICPMANQDEEIWSGRAECLKTLQELSLGISTASMHKINRSIFKIFAKAFVENLEIIKLSYLNIFSKDPVAELGVILKDQMRVVINPPFVSDVKEHVEKKDSIVSVLNKKREENVANKISFERQKESEFMAEYETIKAAIILYRWDVGIPMSEMDFFWNYIGAVETLKQWKEIVSNRKDLSLLDFYKSEYYRQVPSRKISVDFFAKLMTDKQKIKPGDMKDVEHISTMLPFVDMFITDKQRRTQINKFGHNIEYKTSACYAGDEKEIEIFFDSL